MQINYEDFVKVDMRIGRINRVTNFPAARKPSYKLWIDFGPELGVKKSSAQLTQFYTPEELKGKLVVAVVNFPARQIADFMSEVLVLGAVGGYGEVILLEPERDVPLGWKIA
jgi:tRNA-binding protein